jgi:hypothetical protein
MPTATLFYCLSLHDTLLYAAKIEPLGLAPVHHNLFEMKVLPLCYLGQLSEADLARHECSDRIWVHHTRFEELTATGDVGVAAIVRLSNRVEQSVPAVVHAAHYAEDDIIYAPSWVLSELVHDTEDVRCERFMPSLGTQITLLPHTSDHLHAGADPETVLRDGFEQYTCLVKGMDYQIWLGDHAFTATLMDLKPEGQDIICIRGSPLELELLAPLDRPATPPPPPEPAPTPPAPAPAPPTQTAEERRIQIAAAARRRMAAEQALSNPPTNS